MRKDDPVKKAAAMRQPSYRERGGQGESVTDTPPAYSRDSPVQTAENSNAAAAAAALSKQREGRRVSEARDNHDRDVKDRDAREKKSSDDIRRRYLDAQAADDARREEFRLQEEARVREETAARQRRDATKAQADLIAKREAQREKERERQMTEIEKLRQDKVELDRRTNDRDKGVFMLLCQ